MEADSVIATEHGSYPLAISTQSRLIDQTVRVTTVMAALSGPDQKAQAQFANDGAQDAWPLRVRLEQKELPLVSRVPGGLWPS